MRKIQAVIEMTPGIFYALEVNASTCGVGTIRMALADPVPIEHLLQLLVTTSARKAGVDVMIISRAFVIRMSPLRVTSMGT